MAIFNCSGSVSLSDAAQFCQSPLDLGQLRVCRAAGKPRSGARGAACLWKRCAHRPAWAAGTEREVNPLPSGARSFWKRCSGSLKTGETSLHQTVRFSVCLCVLACEFSAGSHAQLRTKLCYPCLLCEVARFCEMQAGEWPFQIRPKGRLAQFPVSCNCSRERAQETSINLLSAHFILTLSSHFFPCENFRCPE